jgi:hypothetical protein
MMSGKKVLGVLLIVMLVWSESCKDSQSISNIDSIIFPEKNISYNRTIQPLFNLGCATTDCHDAQSKASNVDLSSYSGTRYSKFGVVIPRDIVLSRLIWSIEARPGSVPMPPTKSLTLNQIKGFRQWIMEGATDTIP